MTQKQTETFHEKNFRKGCWEYLSRIRAKPLPKTQTKIIFLGFSYFTVCGERFAVVMAMYSVTFSFSSTIRKASQGKTYTTSLNPLKKIPKHSFSKTGRGIVRQDADLLKFAIQLTLSGLLVR